MRPVTLRHPASNEEDDSCFLFQEPVLCRAGRGGHPPQPLRPRVVRWRPPSPNDPLDLLAVGGPTNLSKSDGDAATWLPPAPAYRCVDAARQVAVKARYRFWVTAAEHEALAGILGTCPGQPLPS